jgi:hypothetical protein
LSPDRAGCRQTAHSGSASERICARRR